MSPERQSVFSKSLPKKVCSLVKKTSSTQGRNTSHAPPNTVRAINKAVEQGETHVDVITDASHYSPSHVTSIITMKCEPDSLSEIEPVFTLNVAGEPADVSDVDLKLNATVKDEPLDNIVTVSINDEPLDNIVTVSIKDEPLDNIVTISIKDEPDSEAEFDGAAAADNRPGEAETDGTVLNIDQIRSHYRLEVTEVNIPREKLIPVPKTKERKQYICETCGREFSGKTALDNHLVTHTGERAYQCDICGATFARKVPLSSHLMSHLDFKPYKCKYCPGRFVSTRLRNAHERRHTGQVSFDCKTCGAGFSSIRKLQKHGRESLSCRRWLCTKCNVDFQSRKDKDEHSRIHYACQMCSLTYVSKCALDRHIRAVHTKDDCNHECHVCHKKFHKDYLKKHLLSHKGAMHECDICHKTFKWSASLFKHKRAVHDPSGPIFYECQECNFKCKYKEGVVRHMRLHSGSTFNCQRCSKTFLTAESLESHERKHTGNTLKCLKCGYTCFSNRVLIIHVRKYHGSDPDVFVLLR